MTQAFAGGDGGVLGRGLLTLANVITASAPLAADWSDSHIFNERWPAHARFHGVTALAMSTTLSCATSGRYGPAATARPGPGSSQPFRWPTGRHSSWRRWSPARQSMTRRTRSSDWQACRSACWVRRLPPRRPLPAGSPTAVPASWLNDHLSPTMRCRPDTAPGS